MDSGATTHVIGSKDNLNQIEESINERNIKIVGSENHTIQGVSIDIVKIDSNEINMSNVLYVPTLEKSLISIGDVADISNIVILFSTHYWILDNLDSRNVVAIRCRDPVNVFYRFEFQQ
jgi:hypothetical protein